MYLLAWNSGENVKLHYFLRNNGTATNFWVKL